MSPDAKYPHYAPAPTQRANRQSVVQYYIGTSKTKCWASCKLRCQRRLPTISSAVNLQMTPAAKALFTFTVQAAARSPFGNPCLWLFPDPRIAIDVGAYCKRSLPRAERHRVLLDSPTLLSIAFEYPSARTFKSPRLSEGPTAGFAGLLCLSQCGRCPLAGDRRAPTSDKRPPPARGLAAVASTS